MPVFRNIRVPFGKTLLYGGGLLYLLFDILSDLFVLGFAPHLLQSVGGLVFFLGGYAAWGGLLLNYFHNNDDIDMI